MYCRECLDNLEHVRSERAAAAAEALRTLEDMQALFDGLVADLDGVWGGPAFDALDDPKPLDAATRLLAEALAEAKWEIELGLERLIGVEEFVRHDRLDGHCSGCEEPLPIEA